MGMRAGKRRRSITPKTLEHIKRDVRKLRCFDASLPEPVRRSAEMRRERKLAKAMLALLDQAQHGAHQPSIFEED